MNKGKYFHEYFKEWIETYKLGAVRPVTYAKYRMTLKWLRELAPSLLTREVNRRSYQHLLNAYAETHERQTVMDYHHHLKAALLDAVDEGLLETDPTRKAVIKGKRPGTGKKVKYLSYVELQALLGSLDLHGAPNWDLLILLLAKTGLRLSEALGLTPDDIDYERQYIKVTKTWDYKSSDGGFSETKNESSKRTVLIDPHLAGQLSAASAGIDKGKPVFVRSRVFNSTINNRLRALCTVTGIPVITAHGLRHTHASILIYAGVSVSSIARRLGHSCVTTTQETYLHIIKEMEDKDNTLIMEILGGVFSKEEARV